MEKACPYILLRMDAGARRYFSPGSETGVIDSPLPSRGISDCTEQWDKMESIDGRWIIFHEIFELHAGDDRWRYILDDVHIRVLDIDTKLNPLFRVTISRRRGYW